MATSVYTSLLLKDYKRKAGEIKALRKDLREMAKVVLKREKDLHALRTVIQAREPDINFDEIRPNATYPKVLGMKWNRLTTLILRCLREAQGEVVPSNYITDYVIEQGGIETPDRATLAVVQRCVKDRLRGMAKTGKVIRHHDSKTQDFGLWSLPSGK